MVLWIFNAKAQSRKGAKRQIRHLHRDRLLALPCTASWCSGFLTQRRKGAKAQKDEEDDDDARIDDGVESDPPLPPIAPSPIEGAAALSCFFAPLRLCAFALKSDHPGASRRKSEDAVSHAMLQRR